MTSPKILLYFTETNHPIVHRKLAQVTMHMHAHAGLILKAAEDNPGHTRLMHHVVVG